MGYILGLVFVVEIVGTCILVFFGIATTANALLPGTKGHGIGHMGVSIGFGIGLFLAQQIVGKISGYFNPAIALAVAVRGDLAWSVMGVSWAGQIIGAFLAAMLTWGVYYKHFQSLPLRENDLLNHTPTTPNSVDSTRSPRSQKSIGSQTDDGSLDLEAAKVTMEGEEARVTPGARPFSKREIPPKPVTRESIIEEDQGVKLSVFVTRPGVVSHFYLAPLWAEFLGTFALTYAVLAIQAQRKIFLAQPGNGGDLYRTGIEPLLDGVMLVGIFLCIGGVTGPALNPARDLGPRIAHAILPIPGKGRSEWWYAWVPILGPVAGAIVGAQFNYTMTQALQHGVPNW